MQVRKRDWKNMILTGIDPQKTCLIIIDMQNLFITPGYSLYCEMGAKMIPKLNDFAQKCRERGVHVIYTKSPGDKFDAQSGAGDIPAAIDVREGDTVLVKYRYSSFYCTNLDIIVQERGFDTVLIAGVCTEACCFPPRGTRAFGE